MRPVEIEARQKKLIVKILMNEIAKIDGILDDYQEELEEAANTIENLIEFGDI